MKRFTGLCALLLLVACAQSDQDTYKDPNPTYNRTDAIQYDSSYNAHWIVNGATVANMSSAGALTSTAVTTTTATITNPMTLLGQAYFCGQGANGTTATYIPPVVWSLADDMTTYVYGAAGCDGLDNTTETSGDGVILGGAGSALKIVGMACAVDDGGTDDVYTFQLRDDAADVTGATCSVTLDGSGFDTCSVRLAAPVTAAAGSLMAIEQAAATDDDCSACDTECTVFYTY